MKYLNSFFPFAILFFVFTLTTTAATRTSTSTGGVFSATTTWSTGLAPVAGDDVIIADGATVTIGAAPPSLLSLTVGQGTSGILNIGGFAVTVTGATTIANGGTVNITSATGAKIFTGDFTNNGTWNNSINSPITFGGNITNNNVFTAGTGLYTLNAAAARNINGTISFGSISQTVAGGAYTNNGSMTVTGTHTLSTSTSTFTNAVTTGAYNNSGTLAISIAGATFTNNNTASISGTLTLTGSLTNNGTATISATAFTGAGTLTNGTNATLNYNSTIAIPSILTATASGNTVSYGNTTSAQTVKGTTYVNLTIAKTAQTATLGAATIVNGNLLVSSGTLSDGSFQITGNATGTLTVSSGATLQIGTAAATTFPTNFTSGNINLSGATVTYGATAAQNISSTPTYSNLTITGASVKTALTPGITVNGNLAVNTSGATLSDGGFQIVGNATGTLTVINGATLQIGIGGNTSEGFPTNFTSGNISLGATSTVNYSTITGTSQLVSSLPTYGNLTITGASGTKTLAGNTTVAGNFTISGANTFSLNTYVLSLAGTYTNGGTITANATGAGVVLNGTGAITFTIGTYTGSTLSNLTIAKPNGIAVTLGSALSVAGTIDIQTGTLSTGAFQLAGNAAGTLSVGSAATLQIGAGTATVVAFPTNLVAANITLAAGSSVIYNCTGLQTISSTPSAYSNLTLSGSSIKTANGAVTVNGNLNVTAGTFADGGFQITGNSTGTLTLAANCGLTLGTTTTATNFPTNFTSANTTLNASSTVTYNANPSQTISSVPVYGNLALVATSPVVKILDGNTTVVTNVSIGANNTLDISGYTISVAGATPYSVNTTSGFLKADNSTSIVRFNGSGSTQQLVTLPTTRVSSGYIYNLEVANTGTSLTRLSAAMQVRNVTINSGATFDANASALSVNDTYTNNGSITALNATGQLELNGNGGTQNLTLGTSIASGSVYIRLEISNASGVTLTGSALVGGLDFTSGILNTTSTNILTIYTVSATTNNTTGVSTTSYVNGPMQRQFNGAFSTAGNYTFPVGKSGNNTLALINPTSSGTAVVRAEVFDANSGGTGGSGFTNLSTTRYWQTSFTSGSLTAVGNVLLTEGSLVALNAIGQNTTTLTGAYNLLGGTLATGTITSETTVATGLGYFVIGERSPLSGTVQVGPGSADGIFSFTQAGGLFQAINVRGLSGNLIASVVGDISTEDGANALNQWTEYSGSNYTLTVQSSAATARTISGSYSGAAIASNGLIRLNGADRVTFNGGTGTNRYLVFRNTNTGAQAATFNFINNSTNCQLNNCSIEGAPVSTTNGVVYFGTGTSGGNDTITVTSCDISNQLNSASIFPYHAIYSLGSSTTNQNDHINITNNNISNFFNNGGLSVGIRVEANNSDWNIQGNRLFQKATRTSTLSGSEQYAIYINSGTLGGHTVSSNTIGFLNETGTGIYTIASSPTNVRFAGIYLANTAGTQNTVSGNKISALSLNTSSGQTAGYGIFSGIYISAGSNNVSNNTIGAETGNDSISITSSTSLAVSFGINNASTSANTISGNKIGGITILGSAVSVSQVFTGIYNSSGAATVTISNNLIGSASTTKSIRANTVTTASGQSVTGILCNGNSTGSITVSGNQVRNLYVNATTANTSTVLRGIDATSSIANIDIKNNIIYNLESEASNSGTVLSGAIIGILNNLNAGGSPTRNVENNIIYGLQSNAASLTTNIYGILLNATTGSPVYTVSRNNIHSFNSNNTSTTSEQVGVYVAYNATLTNNMIRLGVKTDGSSITQPQVITGIYDAIAGTSNYYFNSVYIGGANAGSAVNSYAFRRTVATGTKDVRNNIFSNGRTGSGIHLAFATNTLTGYTAAAFDYNIFQSTGNTEFSIAATPAALTGSTAALRLQNLRAQTPVGNNLHSGIGTLSQINFISATGNASTVDLHLNNSNCATGAGVSISGVTTDIDGTITRTSPPTIGAHEGASFAALNSTYDIYTPIITVAAVTPVSASCGTSQTVTITATVTDLGSGLATGSLAPTLWWRLSTGTYASLAASSSSGNTFTYSLSLTGITSGQIYQYYVTAQDQATSPNIWYSTYDATSPVHASVTSAPSPVNSSPATFTVITGAPLSGSITVGTGGTYTTFTAASTGLFNAINTNGLGGNLTVTVISNITETGAVALNQFQEYCGSNFTLLIQPDGTTQRVISGALASTAGLITLNGADRVTIDGSFGGSGTYLKFSQTTAANGAAAICFQNDATFNTVRNSAIECPSTRTAGGVLMFSTSTGSLGNSNNIIEKNIIGTASTSYASNIIYSLGTASALNQNNSIKNNEIRNFFLSGGGFTRSYGIYIAPTGNGSGWNISGNSIYNTSTNGSNTQTALSFEAGASSFNDTIKQNWIGGSSALCGGSSWNNSWDNFSSGENRVRGIYVNAGTVAIDSNNITNIYISNTDYCGFVCIDIAGSTQATITNNVLGTGTNGQPSISKIIQVSGGSINLGFRPGYIYGIWNQSTTTAMSTYSRNDFYYLVQSGAYEGGNVHCIAHQTAGPATITGNRINGPQGNGSYYNQFGIRFEPTASTSGNVIELNSVAGPFTIGSASDNNAYNFGIYARSLSTYTHSGSISRNVVWDMRSNSYGGQGGTEGIYVFSTSGGNANWDIINNQVTLKNNGGTSNCLSLYGIDVALNSASTTNVKYNTVYISGSNGGLAEPSYDFSSYAFFRQPGSTGGVTGDAITLQNNIFINYRLVSNGYVSGHFAIGNVGTANYGTNWNTSNYNFLAVANGGKSYLGYWGLSLQSSLANWQSASSTDANSYTSSYTSGSSNFSSGLLNADSLFLNPLSDLHISTTDGQSDQFVDARATPISTTIDFDSETRDGSTPDVGADEFSDCAAPTLVAKANGTATNYATCSGTSVGLTSNPTGGTGCTGTFEYSWFDGTNYWNGTSFGSSTAIFNSTYRNITYTPTSTDTFYSTARCSNKTTCTKSSSVKVTINPAASTPTSVGNQTACARTTIPNLTASVSAGDTIDWYDSITGGTLLYTGLSFATGQSNGGVYTYYAGGRNKTSGCVSASRTAVTLTLYNVPVITPTATPSSVCAGGSVALDAGATAGSGGGAITTYAWSSGLAGNVSSGTVNPTSTTTYTVTVTDANTCTNTNDVLVTVKSAANSVLLATSTITCEEQCVDNGWTYYATISSPDDWVFAIRKNGNTMNAAVTISKTAGVISHLNASKPGFEHGSYLIGRYWNVTLNSGSIINPVDVKFFYAPSEITAAQSARDAAWATYTSDVRRKTPFRWFKTVGVPFNPDSIVGNSFNKFPNIDLSDVNEVTLATENGVTFAEFDGVTSFSGGTGGFGFSSQDAGLPVKLLSFTANAVENSFVRLNWSTAVEINNAGFDIERSIDGITFEKIGWVKGNDNSTVQISYSYDDKTAQQDIRYYYRLKQIDNGNIAFEYSHIVSAILVSENGTVIGDFVPNPTKGKSTIEFLVTKDQEIEVKVFDMTGKFIKSQKIQMSKGYNKYTIETQDLANATYVVNFKMDLQNVTKRLNVVRE